MEYNVNESPDLHLKVEKENDLKSWLVDYVGQQLNPENDEVNVEMIIEVMAKEFPEFLLPIAEENFIRGYRQAMSDIKMVDHKKEEE
jgi:glucan biosynthesis protein|tara:strand:- start:385 stop:645 length:261 start_codon:yes stop_codon:yes gene_type:complete